MRKLLSTILASSLLTTPALAQDWTSGQRSITYTDAHPLGDGTTNARGGEAPYFANEPADIATDSTTKTNWTISCSSTTVCGGNSVTTGAFLDVAHGGAESKARFDCNDTFDENSDAILKPHQKGNSQHRHHFFGNIAAYGSMDLVDYAWLRGHGNSTCYGGPMNRTLYWEPTLYTLINGVRVSIKAANIVTYYVCGNMTTDPTKCTRWARGHAMIFGFDFNDPNNTRLQNQIAASTASTPPTAFASQVAPAKTNGVTGWFCQYPATPSYTAYAPNQVQGSPQPYLNDGAGHATLNCLTNTAAGVAGAFNLPNGIQIYADLQSQDCWDGYNPRSPSGRDQLAYAVGWTDGNSYCPDHWYRIPHFQAKILFVLKNATELANVFLSSDRMVGMTQYEGGRTIHADLIPAWDYGTGDNPGFFTRFFQHCLGVSMHLKNSDGVTYTDNTGDPHECAYGRIDLNTQAVNNVASPDGSSPNPLVNLNPDMTGTSRFFPIDKGTALPAAVLHPKH